MFFTARVWLVWITCVLIARGSAANGKTKWPLNLPLAAKSSGMQGLCSVYSVDITVGRVGPLTLLVDTGSPAVVVHGDFGDAPEGSSNFLGTDGGAGSATIHYGGSTVSGDISRSQMCFTGGVCVKNFPVFELKQQDAAFSQLGLDGILGLGAASGEAVLSLKGMDETVMDGLASSGSGGSRVFGLYISPGGFFGSSMLSLGGYDSTKIIAGADLQYLPLAQPSTGRWELALQAVRLAPADGGAAEAVDLCQGKTDCRVLIDSGTAQVASAPQLNEALGFKVRTAQGDCVDIRAMPDIHLELAGGAIFKLGPEDYVLNREMCSLAFDDMSEKELARTKTLALILGEPFLRKFYAVFDQEQQRIGLAPSIASSGQQTKNEEHRQSGKEEHAAELRASFNAYLR